MAVVAFGSVRSCGVTTLALSLAATWPPGHRVLLVEADPAGGTLAAGSGWPTEPSLMSLAAAARRGGEAAMVWEHCHELPGRAGVLAGTSSTDHARSALGMAGDLLEDPYPGRDRGHREAGSCGCAPLNPQPVPRAPRAAPGRDGSGLVCPYRLTLA